MGSLIEINTDGLAKLAETICYATGWTAHGRKKMADADSYAVIKQTETEAKAELLRLKGRDEVADYIEARETRKLNNVKSVLEKRLRISLKARKFLTNRLMLTGQTDLLASSRISRMRRYRIYGAASLPVR